MKYRNSELQIEGVSALHLTQKYKTPLYVYSAEAFQKPVLEIQKALKGQRHLICFAVKANSNPFILHQLSKWGLGADVVSGGELEIALRSMIDPQKIVFSGVGKTRDEIQFALKKHIYSFQIESTDEWELLQSLATKRTRYALRVNPNVSAKTHPYISTGLKKNKFGLIDSETQHLLKLISKSRSPARLTGLSMHIGSQILQLGPFDQAFKSLKKWIIQAESTVGRPLEFVDIGGGLGVTYTNENPPSIASWIGLARRYFSNYRILLEPGRLIAANAGFLLTEVIRTKNRNNGSFIVVDAAMNDLMRPSLYQSKHLVISFNEKDTSQKGVEIVGPVCESSDVLARDIKVSTQAKHLAILSCGAYGFSMSSNYNSRTRPAEVWVSGKKMTLIRNREKMSDLLRTLL